MALAVYPELMNSQDFPADAKDRAQRVLGSCRGNSVGTSFCQRWLPLVGCLNWLFLVGVNYQYQNQNTIYNTGVRHNIWLTVFSEKKLYKKQNIFFSNFRNTIVEALWWSQNWIECLDVQAQHLSSILHGLPCQFDSLITCLYWYYDMWLQVLTVTVLVCLSLDRI